MVCRALYRLFAEDGDTPQQAPLAGGKICARVERTAVVPHHDVTRTPDMTVNEPGLLLVIKQLFQDRVALFPRQPFDLAGHQTIDVQSLASGCRMRPRHGMPV